MSEKFNDLKKTWVKYGEEEPYWSVLTEDDYKSNLIENNYEKFYETGVEEVKNIENILKKYNQTLKNKIILDFGCGVGRLTNACTQYSLNVYGIDISEAHLKIAKNKVKLAKFFILKEKSNLPELPNKPEIIISLLTLQHNEPNLIKRCLIVLLNTLQNHGVAIIQIPFKISSTLVNSPGKMQMHFLPKDDVHNLISYLNCTILEEIDNIDSDEIVFNTIYIIKKEANG